MTVAIAGQDNRVFVNRYATDYLFFDILVYFFFHQQLGYCAARINRIDVQYILVSIHCVNQHFFGICRRF